MKSCCDNSIILEHKQASSFWQEWAWYFLTVRLNRVRSRNIDYHLLIIYISVFYDDDDDDDEIKTKLK